MTDTVVKVRIEGIAAGGAGFARTGGKSLFVEGSVPGETVVCRVTEEHHSWLQAELLDVVEASADRVQPACGLYGMCGGCNLQHLGYPAQLTAKTLILKDAFARIGGIDPPEPLVFPSAPWEYRNRMQFHTIRHSDGPLWGLKTRKSADIVPVSDCPIADPAIRGLLRGEKEQTKSLTPPEKDRFTVYARRGLLLSEGGMRRGKTRLLDTELTLDAGLFFQSNGAMLEKLIGELCENLTDISQSGRDLPMADLYCGVGTFAVFLGEMFPAIDLVEENKSALSLARENLALLKWFSEEGRTNFYAQRSEDWAKNNIPRRYGFIVADPPRQGLGRSLALRLASDGPPTLAYVSCDPATLARDSKILLAGGYSIAKLCFLDFYPQTSHIESLALFKK